MSLTREDCVLLQQIYDRLTQMQAECQEVRAIWKQERETAERQQIQATGSAPKTMKNPETSLGHFVEQVAGHYEVSDESKNFGTASSRVQERYCKVRKRRLRKGDSDISITPDFRAVARSPRRFLSVKTNGMKRIYDHGRRPMENSSMTTRANRAHRHERFLPDHIQWKPPDKGSGSVFPTKSQLHPPRYTDPRIMEVDKDEWRRGKLDYSGDNRGKSSCEFMRNTCSIIRKDDVRRLLLRELKEATNVGFLGNDEELIQELKFEATTARIKATPDRELMIASGMYLPQVQVYELSQLALKFERHLDSEIVDFEILNDDFSKLAFLCADHSINLHDRNETMYYKVLINNIEEYALIVYTPTVGLVCQNYSGLFRRRRGMYFSAEDHGEMMFMVYKWPAEQVDMIVVTDGSRILGLGDLGVHGIGIAVGKLDLYVATAGINPQRIFPVRIDVGTNHEKLLKDPLYLGPQQYHLENDEYIDVIDEFIEAIYTRWPHVIVQFEDFQRVAIAGLLKAVRAQGRSMIEVPKMEIVVTGAKPHELLKVLEENKLLCTDLYQVNTDGVILTKHKAEKVIGCARNQYVSSCPSPSIKEGRLILPRESIEISVKRLKAQKDISRKPSDNLKTIAKDEYEGNVVSAMVAPGPVQELLQEENKGSVANATADDLRPLDMMVTTYLSPITWFSLEKAKIRSYLTIEDCEIHMAAVLKSERFLPPKPPDPSCFESLEQEVVHAVCHVDNTYIPAGSPFIPKLIKQFHASAIGEHEGALKTFKKLSQEVFWKDMRNDVEDTVGEWVIEPGKRLDIRRVENGNEAEIIVQWICLTMLESTWEPLSTLVNQFPDYNLEDKALIGFYQFLPKLSLHRRRQ